MSNIAYLRVSSTTQNLERQHEMIKPYNCEKVFEEKVSGKNIKDRPQFNEMMKYVRAGDTLIVCSMSRLSRSLEDLISTINILNKKGVQIKSLKEGDVDTTTANGKLQFAIFSALAEFERDNIRERQAEGIAIAKANGVYKGKQKRQIDEEHLLEMLIDWNNGFTTKKAIMKRFDFSLSTLNRYIAQFRTEEKL